MTQTGESGVGAFDAYVQAQDHTGVPPGQARAEHARAQADLLAETVEKLEAKADWQRAEVQGRLDVLRADLARAQVLGGAGSDDPYIAEAYAQIVAREAKATAELKAVDTNLTAAREAAAAASAEAEQADKES